MNVISVINVIIEGCLTSPQDRYGTGDRTPMQDTSQDVRVLGGSRNASHVTVRFSRPWVTCDHVHDVPLTTDTVRVIYAYDDQIPAARFLTLPYHDSRGVKSLLLKTPALPHSTSHSNATEGALFWDVRAPNVSMGCCLEFGSSKYC
ncbi:DOMON domain [Trinorchestia longiramus]|nr:DOMON domain [Trinorchestia longiramus]